MDVSALSDEELNRAMIWLCSNKQDIRYCQNSDGSLRGYYYTGLGSLFHEYLSDWSLTGPLMVKHMTTRDEEMDFYFDVKNKVHVVETYVQGDAWHFTSTKPLRAICECILMIEIERK